MSYRLAELDKQTKKNLDKIYRYSYDKWFEGEIKDRPTRIGIVKTLINGLHESMVEEGEING